MEIVRKTECGNRNRNYGKFSQLQLQLRSTSFTTRSTSFTTRITSFTTCTISFMTPTTSLAADMDAGSLLVAAIGKVQEEVVIGPIIDQGKISNDRLFKYR